MIKYAKKWKKNIMLNYGYKRKKKIPPVWPE